MQDLRQFDNRIIAAPTPHQGACQPPPRAAHCVSERIRQGQAGQAKKNPRFCVGWCNNRVSLPKRCCFHTHQYLWDRYRRTDLPCGDSVKTQPNSGKCNEV